MEPQKSPGQIHIKTLEEIRLEKAARLKGCLAAHAPETPSDDQAGKGAKPVLAPRDQSSGQVPAFSDVCFTKRKTKQEAQPDSGTEKVAGRGQPEEPAAAGPGPAPPDPTGIRVKTLEEIRREKATRTASRQELSEAESKRPDAERVAKKPRLLRLSHASPAGKGDGP